MLKKEVYYVFYALNYVYISCEIVARAAVGKQVNWINVLCSKFFANEWKIPKKYMIRRRKIWTIKW